LSVELIAILFVVLGGIATAVFVLAATAIGNAEQRVGGDRAPVTRDQLAASILYQVLVYGGVSPEDALRRLRRQAGLAGRITTSIDVTSWAQSYAHASNPQERYSLLETAVQLSMARTGPIPLRQYCALLDVSFALGFQTDALARLREQYGFAYVDHAKNARPREADRGGGATPLFVRTDTTDVKAMLAQLGLSGEPERHEIISAYRRLAALHHPDKVADKSVQAQDAASARFIELTRAYERLLAIFGD
jgi:transposase